MMLARAKSRSRLDPMGDLPGLMDFSASGCGSRRAGVIRGLVDRDSLPVSRVDVQVDTLDLRLRWIHFLVDGLREVVREPREVGDVRLFVLDDHPGAGRRR